MIDEKFLWIILLLHLLFTKTSKCKTKGNHFSLQPHINCFDEEEDLDEERDMEDIIVKLNDILGVQKSMFWCVHALSRFLE